MKRGTHDLDQWMKLPADVRSAAARLETWEAAAKRRQDAVSTILADQARQALHRRCEERGLDVSDVWMLRSLHRFAQGVLADRPAGRTALAERETGGGRDA